MGGVMVRTDPPPELYSGPLFFCSTIHNSDIFGFTDDPFYCHLFARFLYDTDCYCAYPDGCQAVPAYKLRKSHKSKDFFLLITF